HNMPQLPLGTFVAQPGSLMAGFDIFNITVEGKGGHAAMPHLSNDPIPAAAQAVSALQSIVSRNADPLKSGVVSVTQIHSGSSFNVIPQTAKIAGCVRYLDQTVQDMIEQRITDILKGIGLSFDMTVTLDYERRYPPTINDQAEAEFCADVLRQTFGADGLTPSDPMMGSEDFAFMLQRKPGCYIWAGAGAPDRANADLHNPHYDFNDDLLPIGAAYWTQLVKQRLPLRAPSP
ncbi:MAG: amidohydrolase, partial [Pseudomonadota bacterium]